ncbi:MAG: hypothetical protein AB7U46_01350 [Paenirhodobacter sp.]|uniref:hypothetical protein n=1 Tax=Paenirhodobacter sp. TaxID=1965326 RepID=UPI003D13CB18
MNWLRRRFARWHPPEVPAGLRMVIVHIGKTGGTALASVFAQDHAVRGHERARVLGHSETLTRAAQSFPGVEIGFCLRDPVERFVSGFYSRQRKGRPRYNSDWTPVEAEVFTRFPTPDALGRALAAGDPLAARAMEGVVHLKRGLAHYLEGVAALERHGARIGFIGMQESLARDVEWLRRRLDLAPEAVLRLDDVGAHRNPAAVDKTLSPEARAALKAHYAGDYAVRDWCRAKRRELGLD